jgi:hypothetical protein
MATQDQSGLYQSSPPICRYAFTRARQNPSQRRIPNEDVTALARWLSMHWDTGSDGIGQFYRVLYLSDRLGFVELFNQESKT